MPNTVIGIIGGGSQGKAIAYWFAKREFHIVLYDISENQLKKIEDELKAPKKRAISKYIELASRMEALGKCDLIIENASERLELKQRIFKEAEKVKKAGAVLASNSSSFPPTTISEGLTDESRENFINIHYLGVVWGQGLVELVPSGHTLESTCESVRGLLEEADFKVAVLRECPGFIFNRIKAAELSNALRGHEIGMVPLETFLRYILYPTRGFWTTGFIDFLGIDISEALIRFMNERCGDRFYVSRTLAEKVRNNELGIKTKKGFFDYSGGVDPGVITKKPGTKARSSIRNIFVNEMSVNHTNLLIHMLKKGKNVYFDSPEAPYFDLLKKLSPSQHEKLVSQCRFISGGQSSGQIDMTLDCSATTLEEVVKRVDSLRDRFGDGVPIVVNSPVHKVKTIAENCKGPGELIFRMNCQKSYLMNTELVQTEYADPSAYRDIKALIHEIADDCLEVKDEYTSPLILLLVSKYFEAMMILEEDITDMETVELLLDNDHVFRDIDYFGLDNLKFVVDYLEPIYGEPFASRPKLLGDMLGKGYTGVAEGRGFNTYF